jgi:hypothetical protein
MARDEFNNQFSASVINPLLLFVKTTMCHFSKSSQTAPILVKAASGKSVKVSQKTGENAWRAVCNYCVVRFVIFAVEPGVQTVPKDGWPSDKTLLYIRMYLFMSLSFQWRFPTSHKKTFGSLPCAWTSEGNNKLSGFPNGFLSSWLVSLHKAHSVAEGTSGRLPHTTTISPP